MKGGLYRIRMIRDLHAFDFNTDNPKYSIFAFNNHYYMDYDWIEQQLNYMNELSDRAKDIVNAYTTYTDKFINKYLRNSLTDEFIDNQLHTAFTNGVRLFVHQHNDKTMRIITNNYSNDHEYRQNIILYIQQYIEEFNNIILNSPRLTQPITVFRDINDDKFIRENNISDKQPHYFIEKGYMSTSFRIESSVMFTHSTCCLLEITIHPGIPCLVSGHLSRRRGEYEITLLPNTLLTMHSCSMKYILDDVDDHYKSQDIFEHPADFDLKNICTYDAWATYDAQTNPISLPHI